MKDRRSSAVRLVAPILRKKEFIVDWNLPSDGFPGFSARASFQDSLASPVRQMAAVLNFSVVERLLSSHSS